MEDQNLGSVFECLSFLTPLSRYQPIILFNQAGLTQTSKILSRSCQASPKSKKTKKSEVNYSFFFRNLLQSQYNIITGTSINIHSALGLFAVHSRDILVWLSPRFCLVQFSFKGLCCFPQPCRYRNSDLKQSHTYKQGRNRIQKSICAQTYTIF